jgi:cytoskeleton protein RodZ
VETLGQELKRRRETLNIELREVAEKTRVGMRFLHAIEADDFSAIPGGIYARSFIRAYAKQVGMDEEEAINRYRKQTNQDDEDEVNEPQPARDYPSEPSQLSLGLVVIGLLAVIGIGGYAATRYFTAGNSQVQPPVETVQQPVPSSTTPSPTAQQSTLPATETQVPADGAIQQASQTTDELIITFDASGDSWISVKSDDQPNSQMLTIQPGQTKEFKATSKFKVTVGNLPAVKIQINGRPAKLPSSNGLLASNVLITKENLQDFVAAANKTDLKPVKPAANTGSTTVVKPAGTTGMSITGTTTPSSKPAAPAVSKPVVPNTAGSTGPAAPAVKPKPTITNQDLNKPNGAKTITDGVKSGDAKPEEEKPKTESKPPVKPADKPKSEDSSNN